MQKIYWILFVCLSVSQMVFGFANNDLDKVKIIRKDTFGLRLFHYHHTNRKFVQQSNYRDCYGLDYMFEDSLNTESFLILRNSQTGDTILKQACPMFDDMLLLDSGKYIIGMNRTYSNSYHLVVYANNGKVLLKKRFTASGLRFTDEELKYYSETFPCYFKEQIQSNLIRKYKDDWILEPLYNKRENDSLYADYINLFSFGTDHKRIHDILAKPHENWYSMENFHVVVKEKDNSFYAIEIFDSYGKPTTYKLPDLSVTSFIEKGWLDTELCADLSCKVEYEEEPFFELRFGDLEYRFTTKEELKSQKRIWLETFEIYESISFSSCNLVVLFELNGDVDFKEFKVEADGLVPDEFFAILESEVKVLGCSLEQVKVNMPEGERVIPSIRFTLID